MSWADHDADRIVHITHLGRPIPAVAALEEHNRILCMEVIRLEDALAEERRQHARTRARAGAAPRKAPIWLLPFAYVGLAWGAGSDSYAYEPKEEDR